MSSAVKTVHQNLDTQSTEQGGTIEELEKFLEEAKVEQIKRCDLEENDQSSKILDERVNFCRNIISRIKHIADQQTEEGSESHKQAVIDFKDKIQDWDARFGKCENSNATIYKEIDAIKDKTQEQYKTLLNMNNIRDILGSKEQNLEKLKLEIEDIERLINELKIAELKWTEYEEQEKVQKALLDELWPKIDTLKEKHEEFYLQYEVASTNLKPLLNILNLMKDHEDYSEDQDFVSDLLNRVEELDELQHSTKDGVESDLEFIQVLIDEQNDLSTDIDIATLEGKLYRANSVLKNIEEAIDTLKGISENGNE